MKQCLFFSLFFCASLCALPQGHDVTHGDVSLTSHPNELQIKTGDKAIINWKAFSIDKEELVQFSQPGKHSAVLNRVTGGNPSQIFGTLK